jgi:SAM-dependent methyltransferase
MECSFLFKDPKLVISSSDYQNYKVLENSPERDKVDFASSMPVTRSQAILNFLVENQALNVEPGATGGTSPDNKKKVLDYGCNRGAFINLLKGSADVAGYDVSESYRPIIEKLGAKYYTPDGPPPENSFDLLTLIHVAEHLDPFHILIQDGLKALKRNGRVLIQVPDIENQPTDFYVMDHCSHFSASTLDLFMGKSGLKSTDAARNILPGELTNLYELGEKENPKVKKFSEQRLSKIISNLKSGEDKLLSLARSSSKFVVYGAGLIGSLVTAVLKDTQLDNKVSYLIDDNPAFKGQKINGLDVLSLPDYKKSDGEILVAVPPAATLAVRDKCRAQSFEPLIPFTKVQ